MKITKIPPQPPSKSKLKVAAYVRVSKDKATMEQSYEYQTTYYETFIRGNPDWEFAGIYADYALSGTSDTRPAFQRLLKDCRDPSHPIDLIITKSVTRFARNTVILLTTIRELKSLDINIYFQKDQLYSISPDGELLLTLLASFAEAESRSMSENIKWRVKKRFEAGELWTSNLYGYQQIDGKLYIIPEQAEVVRQIFAWYLEGTGYKNIAKRLNEQGIPAPMGSTWYWSTVRRILVNEKYTGNLILQKCYAPSIGYGTTVINHGEKPKYFVADAHEPIISPATFDAVQEEMNRRFKNCNLYGKTYHQLKEKEKGEKSS